jgi:hypothetical protein
MKYGSLPTTRCRIKKPGHDLIVSWTTRHCTSFNNWQGKPRYLSIYSIYRGGDAGSTMERSGTFAESSGKSDLMLNATLDDSRPKDLLRSDLLRDSAPVLTTRRSKRRKAYHREFVGPSSYPLAYPLCGLDLEFASYHHRTFGPREIMVNRIMENYLFPQKVKPWVFDRELIYPPTFASVKAQDPTLGMDLELVRKMLHTEYECDIITPRPAMEYNPLRYLFCLQSGIRLHSGQLFPRKRRAPSYRVTCPRIDDQVQDLVQRHYFEALYPDTVMWLRDQCALISRLYGDPSSDESDDEQDDSGSSSMDAWKNREISHLRSLQICSWAQQANFLFSGRDIRPHHGPVGASLNGVCLAITYDEDRFVLPSWSDVMTYLPVLDVVLHASTDRLALATRQRRSQSQPLPQDYSAAKVFTGKRTRGLRCYEAIFRRIPLRELDRRSRRRSLSRRHIADMFRSVHNHQMTRFADDENPHTNWRRKRTYGARCANCAMEGHKSERCWYQRCGYCNSSEHLAQVCQIAKRNRCKCSKFPTFHIAADCKLVCARQCGNPWPVGHFRHRNAMMCESRCCMCGLKGHSGKQCNLKKCRCGGHHLGQDCGWHPTCRVKDCGRYLCGLHCRECGSMEKPFVGFRCSSCLTNSQPSRRAA